MAIGSTPSSAKTTDRKQSNEQPKRNKNRRIHCVTQSESELMDRNTIDNNMVLKTKPVHHQRLPYYSSKGAGRHFYFYSNHPSMATATLITKLHYRKHESTSNCLRNAQHIAKQHKGIINFQGWSSTTLGRKSASVSARVY